MQLLPYNAPENRLLKRIPLMVKRGGQTSLKQVLHMTFLWALPTNHYGSFWHLLLWDLSHHNDTLDV